MRLAISEMLQSRSENAEKTDPVVGAVLVNSKGNLLSKAHRGKYGEGDHGEFTLLEKCGIKSISGSILYVTLEPCTKRGPRKIPCADRVIDSGIRHVVIGIKDPNPEIWGKGEERLREAGIEVSFFDLDLADEIRTHNAGFLAEQEARQAQIQSMQLKTPDRHEALPVNEASPSDFSESAITFYLSKIGKDFKVPSQELWADFVKSGFLIQGNAKKEFIPTVAGIVLRTAGGIIGRSTLNSNILFWDTPQQRVRSFA